MSHFSTLKTKLTNIETLVKSLQDLGYEAKTDANVRGYHGIQAHSDVVMVLEGGADIGWSFEWGHNGELGMLTDLWAVAKSHDVTELINSINQKYAVNQALKQCQQTGLNNVVVKVGT